MKKFTIALLGVIFVTLIAGSIQSISADHLEPGQGIFKEESEVELVTTNWGSNQPSTHGSNYQIYLQTVFRNGDDQLINVSETTEIGSYIPHKITDHVFDTLIGEKEIVTIDNIKYEKVQYTFTPTLEQRTIKYYPIFEEIPVKYELDKNILALMKELREYYSWKIHYCATFEGHGYVCIPIFQNFAAVELVTPIDVVTLQWTILRVLN